MFHNYIKLTVRSLLRNKTYSILNIVGLTTGIACFILIFLYVQFEFSFDNFYSNADQIFRIVKQTPANSSGDKETYALTVAPMGPQLIENFPEVINGTRIDNPGKSYLGYDGKSFFEKGLFVDEHFLEIFDLSLLQGSRENILTDPYTIVISERLSQKYFQSQDPIGKVLHFRGGKNWKFDVTITGVVKNIPDNSHLHYDFMVSFATLYAIPENVNSLDWWTHSYYTYIQLQKNYSYKEFEQKLVHFNKKYDPSAKFGNTPQKLLVQPLKEIHLTSEYAYEIADTSNRTRLYFIILIALTAIILACINYINLSVARSTERVREISIRKVVGASPKELFKIFTGEAIVYSGISFFCAFFVVKSSLPFFSSFLGKNIEFNFFENWTIPLFLLATVFIIGILSGSYPALFFSSLKPVKVFKNDNIKIFSESKLRNTLVVFQYAVTIILIIASIAVIHQFQFIQKKDAGYDKEHVIIMPISDNELIKQIQPITHELQQNHYIKSATASWFLPTSIIACHEHLTESARGDEIEFEAYECPVDYNYLDVFGMQLLQGRKFSTNNRLDEKNAIIVNETLVKKMGWENPIGKRFFLSGDENERQVIGVVKDFHFHSLHQKIEPAVLFLQTQFDHRNFREFIDYISVRIAPGDISSTIKFLEASMKKFSLDQPFEYYFLDDHFNNIYKAEQRLGVAFSFFTCIAIIIASLGLFGIASFTTARRTKEIGIRKVVGATVLDILVMLSRTFTKWILIANIFAWPIAWFAMNKWLQNFAYRIDLTIWPFLLAGLVAL